MFHDDKVVLDTFTRGIIRRKIKQPVGRAGFTRQDCEDLEQELLLRLLQNLHLFDPDQVHQNVFVTTVIERAAAMILREHLAKKRYDGGVQSLDHARQKVGDSTEPVNPRRSHEEQIDLASDLAEMLARLPDDLRALAERLKCQSPSQAARDLGVPRTSLQRQVERLRKPFSSQVPQPTFVPTEDGLDEITCDKFPLATSYDDVVAALSELRTQQHDYETVVIDSLDWLGRLIWDKLCAQYGLRLRRSTAATPAATRTPSASGARSSTTSTPCATIAAWWYC